MTTILSRTTATLALTLLAIAMIGSTSSAQEVIINGQADSDAPDKRFDEAIQRIRQQTAADTPARLTDPLAESPAPSAAHGDAVDAIKGGWKKSFTPEKLTEFGEKPPAPKKDTKKPKAKKGKARSGKKKGKSKRRKK